MKKYTKSSIVSASLLISSAFIHFYFIEKELFFYKFWFLIPFIILPISILLIILEKKTSNEIFTILKFVFIALTILYLGFVYIKEAIETIPKMHEMYNELFNGEDVVSLFIILYLIVIVAIIVYYIVCFLPIALLLASFIILLIVFIKQYKSKNKQINNKT